MSYLLVNSIGEFGEFIAKHSYPTAKPPYGIAKANRSAKKRKNKMRAKR